MADARPSEILHAVRTSIENSGALPAKTSYLEHEPDLQGQDSGVTLPLVTVTPVSNLRLRKWNTDRVGYTYDANGNQTGRVFKAEYRLRLQIDVWTPSGSDYVATELGNALWDELYKHDSAGPGQPLPNVQDFDPDSVWKFTVRQGDTANDYRMTPSLQRWRVDVTAWANHEFVTTEDYITSVDYPSDGDFSDLDDDGMISDVDDSQDSDW